MLPGPYTNIWTTVFSHHDHNVLALMRQAATHETGTGTICFRRLVLPPPGIGSIICQHVGIKTKCGGVQFLQAATDWIRQSILNMGGVSNLSFDSRQNLPQLTLVQRVDYSSNHKLTHGVIYNFEDLLSALHFEFAHRLRLQIVDFAQLSFQEQIQVASSTDILIGAHGAGLTHCMWMKPRQSALIEIFTTFGEGANHHYHNIAHYMEVGYFSLRSGRLSPHVVNIDTLRLKLERAINFVKVNQGRRYT